MKFLNRIDELARLDSILGGGLAVLYGRRRIGKTRLLVEWANRNAGVYCVADQSAPDIQRRYLASTLATVLPGFADVEYPDWRSLFERISTDAPGIGFRGPVVLDELPYLALASPELPSVLQQWVDHGMRAAGLSVAMAGSSQRMMQGLVLDQNAPLFGRADQMFEVSPLSPSELRGAFSIGNPRDAIELYAAWGGVPRYWELAERLGCQVNDQVSRLVLDPAGPLHQEPDRLLLEELPSAAELRPVLDAIGGGVHRVSEIAGRLGRPATSLARPLERLVGMGLVRREVPFGEPPRKSRRSLYKIADPFFRMWFWVVAPNRSLLAAGSAAARKRLLTKHWQALAAATWEDLCRIGLPQLRTTHRLASSGPWGPASRWWHKAAPEWDLVAANESEDCILLGEVKLSGRPLSKHGLSKLATSLAARVPPDLPAVFRSAPIMRSLFVPEIARGAPKRVGNVLIVTARDLGI